MDGGRPVYQGANHSLGHMDIAGLYPDRIHGGAAKRAQSPVRGGHHRTGATSFQQFKSITLPMVSPTTFYLVIVRLIAVFKIFGSVNVFTMGSSITSNTSMVQEIYTTAFANYQHGYASAQSVVLLIIIVFFTAVNFAGQKRWVHY